MCNFSLTTVIWSQIQRITSPVHLHLLYTMRCLAIVLFWSSLVMVSSAILFDAKGRASSQLPECPLGEYRSPNLIGPSCLPCSTCPPNHIIRKLCTPDSDTECTLYKFDLINPDLSPDQHKQEMDAMLSEYWQEVLKEQEGNQNHVSTGYAMNRNSAPEERVPSGKFTSLYIQCICFFHHICHYVFWFSFYCGNTWV